MGSTHRERPRVKEFGLSEVYTSQDPQVDVVFVHGLNGSAYATWATKKSDIFWPADLLPRTLPSQQLRILTYGYDANVSAFMDGTSKDKIHNHAEHLAAHLFANRNLNGAVDRPIVFICHSLGGLVVKKCLTFCSRVRHEHIQHLRSTYVSTYGILFLGTPHNGSDVAKFGSLLQSICGAVLPKKLFDTSPQLIQSLKTDNEHLQIINRDFVQIIDRFRIYFFHESKPMDLKSTRAFIVDEASAAPLMDGVERMGIEADHGSMCRFEDRNSPGYEAVSEAVFRYSRDAPKIIPARWAQEYRERAIERQEEARRLYGLNDPLGGSLISLQTEKFDSLANSVSTLLPNPPSEIGEIPQSQDPEKDPFIRVVPPGFHPNSTFFGMEKEMNELHNRLYKAKKRATGTASVLLYAVPGAGKSHLARQYMYTYQSLYPGGIFWIDCRTRESRYNGIWQIAQMVDELTGEKESHDPNWGSTGVYVDSVRKWLGSRENWLLIFDGISFEHSKDIDEFKNVLPYAKETAIIYTSVDRSLSKKQRLLEPYGLEVKRLAVSDACKLLYKDLGIKHPTSRQEKKAIDLVNYYQCLPLAIHAIGHRLRASGKALEKYKFGSHLTDEKLAEPFRDIMKDLAEYQHVEALNLIKILSFFGHHIPVGMLNLGRKALNAYSVEIRTSDRGGSNQRHIDNTFTTLMRYGLIERTLYLYSLNDNLGDSGTLVYSQMSSDADDSHASDNDNFSTASRSTIETVKIHTVVQKFCRDELTDQGESHYYWWLALATALFCLSYDNAKAQMRATRGSGLTRDYREYLTHARRLISHFPTKFTGVAMSLRNLHATLKKLESDMQDEIENRSPGSSQESFRNQKSIFDRTSSMSSVPDTPDSHTSASAWPEGFEEVKSESPVDIYFPHQIVPSTTDPSLHIPIIAEEVENPREIEDGSYTSGLSRVPSQNTEIPQLTIDEGEEGDEEGWQKVEKRQRGWISALGRLRRVKGKRNLGDFRPRATVSVTEAHAKAESAILPKPSIRSIEGRSDAESSLAAVHHSSPPPTRGGGIKPANRAPSQKDNSKTYAYVLANQPNTSFARRSAPSLSNQQPPSTSYSPELAQGRLETRRESMPTSGQMDRPFDALSQSTHSDPGMPVSFRKSPNPNVRHQFSGSAAHSRNSSRSTDPPDNHGYTPLDPYDSQRVLGPSPMPLPYQRDIAITYGPQYPALSNLSRAAAPPSPLASPPYMNRPNFPMGYLPAGYSSQPMSRDHSAQSEHSLRTEPARFPPNFSPAPNPSPFGCRDRAQMPFVDTRRVQHIMFGPGESGADSSTNSPVSFEAPGMSRGPSGPGLMVNSGDGMSRSLVEFSRVPNTQHIQFGETNPVNVEAARRRARAPYPSHNLIPTGSDDAQLQMLLSGSGGPGFNGPHQGGQRQRSGSSPVSRHDLNGFGVQFQ
ncbi:hypothetical protein D8B26_003189 [Coccidioides posadasii str. Silveira]|uniref:Uncharacterized protein n=1 Tax=Coccidioides posadasii (strain RMSCC 757 / Silveira) TaxID=443226 RepID=E9CYY5_COCPS|nr:hypothetical protein CPSG_02272 [Coccidioides posadasii str. Silveira]QVM08500.1 hypothetical protein D8B26_003189 [Coccidioides posadasii str. Silveira]